MADPISLGVIITGLVGAYKAYADYKAAVVKAQAEQQPAPAKSEDVTKGEQVAPIIKAGVEQHGDAKDRRALDNFEDDPDTYQEALQKVLTRLAAHAPPFAQQLQTLAQQANLQTGGVQGSVTVTGKVIGTVTGVNTGTISGSYTINDDDAEQRGRSGTNIWTPGPTFTPTPTSTNSP
jgi:hypothetical protein